MGIPGNEDQVIRIPGRSIIRREFVQKWDPDYRRPVEAPTRSSRNGPVLPATALGRRPLGRRHRCTARRGPADSAPQSRERASLTECVLRGQRLSPNSQRARRPVGPYAAVIVHWAWNAEPPSDVDEAVDNSPDSDLPSPASVNNGIQTGEIPRMPLLSAVRLDFRYFFRSPSSIGEVWTT